MRAMGAWGAMGGVGGVAGGVLGGVITQYLGWEWTLFINVPIGIACATVAARVLEHDERPEARRNFDALGAVEDVTERAIAALAGFKPTAD